MSEKPEFIPADSVIMETPVKKELEKKKVRINRLDYDRNELFTEDKVEIFALGGINDDMLVYLPKNPDGKIIDHKRLTYRDYLNMEAWVIDRGKSLDTVIIRTVRKKGKPSIIFELLNSNLKKIKR